MHKRVIVKAVRQDGKKNMTKTVKEIVDEYINRTAMQQINSIIIDIHSSICSFQSVTNLSEDGKQVFPFEINVGYYHIYEFDYLASRIGCSERKYMHYKCEGKVLSISQSIEE
ncbi:MAG: hypothetical protein ABFD07_14115 [Methanobacterium sp.]